MRTGHEVYDLDADREKALITYVSIINTSLKAFHVSFNYIA